MSDSINEPKEPKEPKEPESPKSPKNPNDFVVTFVFSALVSKIMIIYFGANYSEYPGQGYGYGLLGAILLTLTLVGRFLWRHWHDED